MNDEFLEDLPPPPPTLRRQNAISSKDIFSQSFIDTETKEIITGNPDVSHSSNKNLVRLIPWQPRNCKPDSFFYFKEDDHNGNPGMNSMIECNS